MGRNVLECPLVLWSLAQPRKSRVITEKRWNVSLRLQFWFVYGFYAKLS